MSNPLDMCCKTTCDPKAVDEWIAKKDATIADQSARIEELEAGIAAHKARVLEFDESFETTTNYGYLWDLIDKGSE